MSIPARRFSSANTIWLLALGYMAFYAPYSGVIKSLSSGLLSSGQVAVPRFTILPIVLLATVILVTIAISISGWWRYLPMRTVLGVPVPKPRFLCILSGISTASIIVSTSLAYTFSGISIVFALLLMRGGVLVMAPIIDWSAGRTVHRWSAVALVLSLLALSIALIDESSYVLSMAAFINLLAYLGGYFIRLEAMSRLAKSSDVCAQRRFFVEEQSVSLTLLFVVPMVLAIIGSNSMMLDLRAGYAGLAGASFAGPAWLIGSLYGCLFLFGSFIYLDSRENTFCIPINRCVSVISGLIATAVLAALFDLPGISMSQIVAALFILLALFVLAIPSVLVARRRIAIRRSLQNANLLFVCNGNTSRSPMGAALCRAYFAKELGLDVNAMHVQTGRIASAGLTAKDGVPLDPGCAAALESLNICMPNQGSRMIDAEMVTKADWVFCMTEAQRLALVDRFPEAEHKVQRLHADLDIAHPAGDTMADYLEMGHQIATAVETRAAEIFTRPALA